MNKFVNETIEIINAIQRYIDKHGNADVVEKYYQEHGSYKGVVKYLEEVDNQPDIDSILPQDVVNSESPTIGEDQPN